MTLSGCCGGTAVGRIADRLEGKVLKQGILACYVAAALGFCVFAAAAVFGGEGV